MVRPKPARRTRTGEKVSETLTESQWSLGDSVVDFGVEATFAKIGITDAGERFLEGVQLDADGRVVAAEFSGRKESGRQARSTMRGHEEKLGAIGERGTAAEGQSDQDYRVIGEREIRHRRMEGGVGQANADGCIECGVLLCGDTPDADPDVFEAANNSGLVYDGRMVVDSSFRTSDPSILSGGTFAKFSRLYGTDVPWLEAHNSREVRHLSAHCPCGLVFSDKRIFGCWSDGMKVSLFETLPCVSRSYHRGSYHDRCTMASS